MKFGYVILMSMLTIFLYGQDKKSTRILDKLSQNYDKTSSLKIEFDLTIDYPEQESTTYPSTVIQSGNKWVFRNSEQELYNNGKDIWVYIPSQNEVQINDFDEEEAEDYFVSPLGLLSQYKSGKYAYQLAEQTGELSDIEFKPLDDYSDYSKFRITVNHKRSEVKSIVAFGKDGSKAILKISNLLKDQKFTAADFVFDTSKHPGVRVEDLRLD